MKVAVIGSGGREHALAWKVAQSPLVTEVFCVPGNGGTAGEPNIRNVASPGPDVPAMTRLCCDLGAAVVVIGPEAPLVAGQADALRAAGVPVVGPDRAAARLEGSKAFAKSVMERAGVPTARAVRCTRLDEAAAAIDTFAVPPVVKADGLAAGKGVVVASSTDEALAAARAALVERRYGDAGASVLIEERLEGVEASYIVLSDGERFVSLPTSQDHKRLLDGDRGPNTGGMGAYVPNPFVDAALDAHVRDAVIGPVLAQLAADGCPFNGFLYAGLMLTADGPRVLEFNVRCGDPETQPLMFGLEGDLVPVLQQVAAQRLTDRLPLAAQPTCAVVMASAGYPGSADQGKVVEGLVAIERLPDVKVFHAATAARGGRIMSTGGRVLAVTARADTLPAAIERAYAAAEHVGFEGCQYRRDIGRRAL